MPQLGETVTEGTITRWLKALGDKVEQDEPLFEVSTDKVDSEVPSPASGYLTEILVPEGETVDVGARLAVINESMQSGSNASATSREESLSEESLSRSEERTTPSVSFSTETPTGSAASLAPTQSPVSEPRTSAAVQQPSSSVPTAAPGQGVSGSGQGVPTAAPGQGVESIVAQSEVTSRDGLEPAGQVSKVQEEAGLFSSTTADQPVESTEGVRRVLSPVVRRLLAEHGIDPSEVRGTGMGGRITRADVLAHIDRLSAASKGVAAQADRVAPVSASTGVQEASSTVAPRPQSPPGPASGVAVPTERAVPAPAPVTSPGDYDEVVPFTNIRRRTAEHMVRSKATSPHAFMVIDADFEGVERARRMLRESFLVEEGFSLTYLPFVAKAVVEALRAYPNLNASVEDDSLIIHHRINLGIAVDLDLSGLIVPVIKDADSLGVRGLARAVHDLATRARTRKLSADDISGGTFSISNPGPYGTLVTAPIINQPQVAILSMDGVKRRPVVVSAEDGTEAIAVHSVGMLGVSWDHRAVDGAYIAAFLRRLADIIGTRDWVSEL